jgi:hypothetical protein
MLKVVVSEMARSARSVVDCFVDRIRHGKASYLLECESSPVGGLVLPDSAELDDQPDYLGGAPEG